MSKSQELLSKTLGYKNLFEIKNTFINPDHDFVIINDEKYDYYLTRFINISEQDPYTACKITNPALPEKFSKEKTYDKWGTK